MFLGHYARNIEVFAGEWPQQHEGLGLTFLTNGAIYCADARKLWVCLEESCLLYMGSIPISHAFYTEIWPQPKFNIVFF